MQFLNGDVGMENQQNNGTRWQFIVSCGIITVGQWPEKDAGSGDHDICGMVCQKDQRHQAIIMCIHSILDYVYIYTTAL